MFIVPVRTELISLPWFIVCCECAISSDISGRFVGHFSLSDILSTADTLSRYMPLSPRTPPCSRPSASIFGVSLLAHQWKRLEWTRYSYLLVYTNVQQISPAIPPPCPNVEWKFTVNAAVMSSSIRHVISSLRDYKFTNSITRLHKYLPVGRNDKRRFPLILLSHCTLFFHNFTC